MEKINPISYFLFHLYLLQLEEYDLGRFIKAIWNTKGIPPVHTRKRLVFTSKAILLTAFTIGFFITASIVFSPGMLLGLYCSYLLLIVAVIVTLPFDLALKYVMIQRAAHKMRKLHHLKVIAVAGSYGKTTMKEALYAVLSQKYVAVMTPDNINTPLGIAAVILKRISAETQLFIVEMGEYQRHDIEKMCALVHPGLGVITGINEAHLERMGSLDNAVHAIFELAESLGKEGYLVMNGDDRLVQENYKTYIKSPNTYLYSSSATHELKTQLLGRYAVGVMDGVGAIATYLGLSNDEIRMGAASVQPVAHRLQPISGAEGVLVIDDSYNGNPAGVTEAIYTLSTFTTRRKIYVTPGLVEMGSRVEAVHRAIGKELAPVADLVVLIKTSVTPFIVSGLQEAGFDMSHILYFSSMPEVQAHMQDFVKPHDVILFQNDWPDNYV